MILAVIGIDFYKEGMLTIITDGKKVSALKTVILKNATIKFDE